METFGQSLLVPRPDACPLHAQSKLDKSGPPKAEEVVRAYDNLIGHVKELSETATRLGGSAGETLLEECTAQVLALCSLDTLS